MSADPQDQTTIAKNEIRTENAVNIISEEPVNEPVSFKPNQFIDTAAPIIVDARGKIGGEFSSSNQPGISYSSAENFQAAQENSGEERIMQIKASLEQLSQPTQAFMPEKPIVSTIPVTLAPKVSSFPQTSSLVRPQAQTSSPTSMVSERQAKMDLARGK